MFHVFVEGAVDDTPEGRQRLAQAIASHYGLPAPDLAARIERGRFRVKGNIDRATADSYVRDLGRLGARCAVEEASASNRAATPLPFPAVRPATPPAGLPAVAPSRPTPPTGLAAATPPGGFPRAATPPPVGGYQSGLAAAFAPPTDTPQAGLGALEREDVQFSLSSVDGADDSPAPPPPAASFEPPGGAALGSIGPPPDKPAVKLRAPSGASKPPETRAKASEAPLDMFAPPDAADDAVKFDLAEDERPRARASTPPAGLPAAAEPEPAARASTPAMRRSQPIAVQTGPFEPVPSHAAASKLGPLANPRTRMIAGVVLAILLGFVPAHLFARAREKSTFDAIDQKVGAIQGNADTSEAYDALDHMRASQLARKEAERRNIAILAIVIWAIAGGGLGYVWFRRIPWDRVD